MERLNQAQVEKKERPIVVLQYGEGNFLRAFADHMIDVANEQGITDFGIAMVKPRKNGTLSRFREQDELYTVLLRGYQHGAVVDEARVITSIQKAIECYGQYEEYEALARLETLKLVVSNTTEAGIVFEESDRFELCPPDTFPGKLTKLLYQRFEHFHGDPTRGLIMLPCELNERNGQRLQHCVNQYIDLWKLGDGFRCWVEKSCTFCNTLVDRIVTGAPKDEGEAIAQRLGYEDPLLDIAEPFAFWGIEQTGTDVQGVFPLDRAGLPVLFVQDLTPYRERKVRILNGAHTATALAGYLAGFDTVGELMADPVFSAYLKKMVYEEIVPTVPLPQAEASAYASAVFERFGNPFLRHSLLDISLNSVSKWKTRVLPSLKDFFQREERLPRLLTFSFAALLAFYRGARDKDGLKGTRGGEEYPIRDDREVMEFFAAHSAADSVPQYVEAAAAHSAFWEEDLRALPGFVEQVSADLQRILDIAGFRVILGIRKTGKES